ncbi:MAG: ParB N-terminal domain-containing protein [Thermoguttaceae bacterium]|nr:ParB N-terminal domain-containing protein [Thermoguttaceae bacterium]
MTIYEYNLSEIRPYQNNPRNNQFAVDGVAESIRRFGFKQPIVIDADKTIVCGHTRYLAALKLKLATVPCVLADDLSDDEIKAYRILDNKLHELSSWDDELLARELDSFEFDFEPFGVEFSCDDDAFLEDEHDDVDVPQSFQLIVECDDEESQDELYERLKQEGYRARICNL